MQHCRSLALENVRQPLFATLTPGGKALDFVSGPLDAADLLRQACPVYARSIEQDKRWVVFATVRRLIGLLMHKKSQIA